MAFVEHISFCFDNRLTGSSKAKAWKEVTNASNALSSVRWSIQEVKRKWFGRKLDAKENAKHRSAHRYTVYLSMSHKKEQFL